jgi:hypothetical protein
MSGIYGMGTGLSVEREKSLRSQMSTGHPSQRRLYDYGVRCRRADVGLQKSTEDATRIMRTSTGRVKAPSVLSVDIAATKADQVHTMARKHEYPLRCIVEKA